MATSLKAASEPSWSREDLEELVLESHLGLGLETDTGTENVGQSGTLLSQGVDNRGARRGQGSLEHVAEDAEDGVEALVVGSDGTVRRSSLPLDAGHELSNDDEIDDQRSGKEGVLADVEDPRNQGVNRVYNNQVSG